MDASASALYAGTLPVQSVPVAPGTHAGPTPPITSADPANARPWLYLGYQQYLRRDSMLDGPTHLFGCIPPFLQQHPFQHIPVFTTPAVSSSVPSTIPARVTTLFGTSTIAPSTSAPPSSVATAPSTTLVADNATPAPSDLPDALTVAPLSHPPIPTSHSSTDLPATRGTPTPVPLSLASSYSALPTAMYSAAQLTSYQSLVANATAASVQYYSNAAFLSTYHPHAAHGVLTSTHAATPPPTAAAPGASKSGPLPTADALLAYYSSLAPRPRDSATPVAAPAPPTLPTPTRAIPVPTESATPTAPTAAVTTAANGTRRYLCPVCSKGFSRPSSLQTHLFTHTGEKPFPCLVDGCEKRFSVLSNLRRHQKIHAKNDEAAAAKAAAAVKAVEVAVEVATVSTGTSGVAMALAAPDTVAPSVPASSFGPAPLSDDPMDIDAPSTTATSIESAVDGDDQTVSSAWTDAESISPDPPAPAPQPTQARDSNTAMDPPVPPTTTTVPILPKRGRKREASASVVLVHAMPKKAAVDPAPRLPVKGRPPKRTVAVAAGGPVPVPATRSKSTHTGTRARGRTRMTDSAVSLVGKDGVGEREVKQEEEDEEARDTDDDDTDSLSFGVAGRVVTRRLAGLQLGSSVSASASGAAQVTAAKRKRKTRTKRAAVTVEQEHDLVDAESQIEQPGAVDSERPHQPEDDDHMADPHAPAPSTPHLSPQDQLMTDLAIDPRLTPDTASTPPASSALGLTPTAVAAYATPSSPLELLVQAAAAAAAHGHLDTSTPPSVRAALGISADSPHDLPNTHRLRHAMVMLRSTSPTPCGSPMQLTLAAGTGGGAIWPHARQESGASVATTPYFAPLALGRGPRRASASATARVRLDSIEAAAMGVLGSPPMNVDGDGVAGAFSIGPLLSEYVNAARNSSAVGAGKALPVRPVDGATENEVVTPVPAPRRRGRPRRSTKRVAEPMVEPPSSAEGVSSSLSSPPSSPPRTRAAAAARRAAAAAAAASLATTNTADDATPTPPILRRERSGRV
ncbi:hypothetical protein AMAG_19604 [Allomyces macrogynus ATCC 38327]|uniref:C2H2-type domain-containing protein n=1 Tax=Allomyces macrogynus (strain ATCC 38327) TaxID=578462 RepID=A0A0L0SVY9_ALLM3|nr:hypothetical protein AMAG_19604 [Allomyces macrogynus ATCC 38327]|eukprot:KNE66641.1 hypothetical protein AMAG_19604 [Allomyces macrogynus ATCC 38327]